MIKAVIFDMGGVLLRTEDRASRTALGARYGLSYEQIDELVFNRESALRASVGEISEEEHWASIAGHLGFNRSEIPAFREAFWDGDREDEELLELIDSFRPRLRTALLSNAWSNARRDIGLRHNILRVFDVVIFSAELKMAKPNPRIYQHALDLLGVEPEEAIFVDDMPANVEAANALGIHGIQFLNTQQIIHDLQARIP